ncbi:hypothetical protein WA026_016180 [Henosepilachna vigintioctopunctata]|uniref:carbonic anhydrase n=1 Tax=Henosepilachna vigintioctopunctata TaxID=420089 RepID=A0AAW1TTW2_9CUCU
MDYQLIILSFVIVFTTPSEAWNYKQQDLWPVMYCQKAIAQSPIDLQPNNMTNLKTTPLKFSNWDENYNLTVRNSGHTIQAELPCTTQVTVSGGYLPGTFKLFQFHFHWGAEHTINEQRFALEAHFVTHNTKYNTAEEAVRYTNGIAVVTILFDFSDKENRELQPIIQQVGNLKQVGQTVQLQLNPASFLPNDVKNFYRYFGSLTTPNCNDVVVWTIFTDLSKINKRQVDKFRTINGEDGTPLTENVRKIQPLNGRLVYKIST